MADLEITRHDSETGGEYRAHPADSDAIGRFRTRVMAAKPLP